MSNAQWKVLLSPPARNCVQITRANATRLNLDVNIVIFEWLRLQFVLVEFCPFLGILNLETDEAFWVNHGGFN